MFKLDNNFLIELGLGSLPAVEKNKMLAHIYETLEMRVGMRLAEQMSNEQLDEFEGYINRQDEAGALKWLETNFPNYKQVVAEELDKLKNEIKQVAPQIVAQSQQAQQAAAQSPQSMASGGVPQQAASGPSVPAPAQSQPQPPNAAAYVPQQPQPQQPYYQQTNPQPGYVQQQQPYQPPGTAGQSPSPLPASDSAQFSQSSESPAASPSTGSALDNTQSQPLQPPQSDGSHQPPPPAAPAQGMDHQPPAPQPPTQPE